MNENRSDKRIGEKIKKVVVAGVRFLGFIGREEIIIEKEQIKSILPHRKGKLFLDRVIITAKKITGEFLITAEACEGHEIGGQPMFRGVDYPEMTAQLLGIWLARQATQYPQLNERLAPLRKASFKCIGSSIPGDILRVEIPIKERNEEEGEEGNPRMESVKDEDRLTWSRQQAIVINAEAWVGDKKKAVIYFVELSIVDVKSLVK